MIVSRSDFRVIVTEVARRTRQPETVVVASFVSRVERNASLNSDPARVAYLDQVAAAFRDELGPAMNRDLATDHDRAARRFRRQYGMQETGR